MGKGHLAIILAFTLLLTAGLDYTGRNIHRGLGGDRNCYTFLLPEPDQGQVVFCGHVYADYQAKNLWNRDEASFINWLRVARYLFERSESEIGCRKWISNGLPPVTDTISAAGISRATSRLIRCIVAGAGVRIWVASREFVVSFS